MVEQRLLVKVRMIVRPYACRVIELQADSVGVQGDARVFGPTVVVWFPARMTQEQISELTTRILNEVRGITRVLRELDVQEFEV